MSRQLTFTVDDGDDRLDRFLARRCTDLSRSRLQRLIADGHVTVDRTAARPASRLRPGQVVAVTVPETIEERPTPQQLPLEIVYQDDDILVVDKRAGMTVHPAPGHPDGTLVNAVLALVPGLAGTGSTSRPGIVHRLDKDTSGLLVVAKTERVRARLARQLKERGFTKRYLVLVHGRVSRAEAVIEADIARDPRNRKRMAVVVNGRRASTRYRVLTRYRRYSLLDVAPSTGRTHQIRVHFASLGHPLAGDATYGKRHPALGRQFLHACALGFHHPSTGEYVEFTSELPQELVAFLETLKPADG